MLDHRRVPLPRETPPKVASIRASDFQADPGVLPNSEEQFATGTCIVKIEGARHNDMHGGGSGELKAGISRIIHEFLRGGVCGLTINPTLK